MKNLFLIFTLLLSFSWAFAQQKDYTFINYNSRNGLSSNSINTIIKDKYGFMWFGSEDGLNRFDGQSFKSYRHKESDPTSLHRGAITSITQDKSGNIWVGTNFALSLYNPNIDAFDNFDFSKYGWINCILADYKGKIWVGTYSGLFLFDPKTKTVKPVKIETGQKSKVINYVFEDKRNNIWVGTENGLHRFDRNTEKFLQYLPNPNRANSISSYKIRTINEDTKGNLWIGTHDAGINMFDVQNGTFKSYKSEKADTSTLSNNDILKIVFDSNENLWVGTIAGVDILNPVSGKVTRVNNIPVNNNGFNTNGRSVRDIFIDTNGTIWLAVHQGGINKYDPNLAYFNHKQFNTFDPNGLTASSIMTFAEDPSGDIYIGIEGGGINNLNRKSDKIRPFKLSDPKVNSSSFIALQTVGNTLLGASYQMGLYSINFNSGSSKYIPVPKSKTDETDVPVNCFKIDHKGKIWLGTNGGGVKMYDLAKNTILHEEDIIKKKLPINQYVTSIEEDKAGNIWMGTNGTGIIVYNPEKASLIQLNMSNSNLPIDRVHTIFCDRSGRIWVGSLGGGLCLYHPKKKAFELFDENYFLANDIINKILEDEDGKIWVSTNQGISSFDPTKKIFKNFNRNNGVQQSTFNIGSGLKTSDGEIFFGGLDGFNYFYPTKIATKKSIPNLVITALRVNNKLVNAGPKSEINNPISDAEEIELNYKQNFALDYIALNYTAPHENRYSYKLDGFDKEWNLAGENKTATYTNLDPGHYTLRLKAQSDDGSWTTTEKTIAIVVNPPFWKTWYAYAFYILAIGAILWSIRRRSIQKLQDEFARKQEKLEVKHLIEKERLEAEQKMELEKGKVKFLTNLSHELKTPLTLVINPIENLMFQEQSPQKLEMLNLISRNAKRLLNLVNQLLDFKRIETNELSLNLSEGDIVSFTQEIVDSFRYIAVRKNIQLLYSSKFSSYLTQFDKDKLERILINLISNAIKFTNDGGSVTFNILENADNGIKITVSDTGIGLPKELQEKVFERFYQVPNQGDILNQGSGIGLSIAQEFVHLHGGEIKLNSEEGKGTTFTITLPLQPISVHSTQSNQDEFGEITGFAQLEPPKIELPTILIVDDDEDLRTYLVESLKTRYKVVEAANGRQGWQKALAHHPQVIVSDVDMPIVGGIEMVEKLKNDKRTKHIPVIILTVIADEASQLKGLEAGASDYLSKPFSFNLLSIKIENLLSLSNELKSTFSKQILLDTKEPEIIKEDEKFLLKVNAYIDDHIEDPELSIEALSKAMFVSRGTLYNKLLSLTGETPVEYVRSQKLKKAATLLQKSDMKISQIGYAVGFSNPNYFARAFKTKYNVSPTEYLAMLRRKES